MCQIKAGGTPALPGKRRIGASVSRKLLIHIGYHKTGTSWLQTHLFPNAALGLGLVDRDLVRNNVIGQRPLTFCGQTCAAELEPKIEELQSQNLYPVVSHEALSGNPHSGGYQSKEIADRLASVFPSAKILIVIREQRAMIHSCYQQYIKIGGRSGIEEYVQPPQRWSARIPLFSLENFKYHLLVEYYHRLFGQENVCVIPYELFFCQPTNFVESILSFAGVPINGPEIDKLPLSQKSNVTPPPFSLEAKRRLNFLYPVNKLHRLDALSPEDQRRINFVDETAELIGRMAPSALQDSLKKQQRDWIEQATGDMYEKSNQRLATICGIDLSRFKYCLPANAGAKQASSVSNTAS